MAIISITCPCCEKLLEIDTSTQKVISVKDKKEFESLDDFVEKQKHRSEELDAMFAAAKEKEKNRFADLEKKFEEAKKNKNLKDPAPGIFWD